MPVYSNRAWRRCRAAGTRRQLDAGDPGFGECCPAQICLAQTRDPGGAAIRRAGASQKHAEQGVAPPAGDLATLGSRRPKLLTCPGRELSHIMHINTAVLRELSRARSVYPGVEQLGLGNGRTQQHVE